MDSQASGNWNAGGTWVGGVVPTTTTAVIKAGHTVTATANVAGIGANTLSAVAIQIEETAALMINTGITLVALGDVQVSGQVTIGPGAFLDVRAIAEGTGPSPVTRRLTINPSGSVTANGTSTNPSRIGSTIANAAVIDGAGALTATYTSFAGLYGMGLYFSVWPAGAGISRFHPTAQWEYNMVTYGMQHHVARAANPNWPTDVSQISADGAGATIDIDEIDIDNVYYDGMLCYYNIADYTGDPTTWNPAAQLCCDGFRAYALYMDPDGNLPAYRLYSAGLAQDWLRTGDTTSRDVAIALSVNGSFAADGVPLAWTAGQEWHRENVLPLYTHIVAHRDLGQTIRTRRADLVTQAYDHWHQVAVDEVWIGVDIYVQPWMFIGLGFRSLYYDWVETGDTRFLPALIQITEYMIEHGYDATAEAFYLQMNPTYSGHGPPPQVTPAPDLNLEVTPCIAFLWWQTGITAYRDLYDTLFARGVRTAYLYGAKQWDENYFWSFQGQTWRALTPVSSGSTGGSMFAGAVIGR